MAIGVGIVALSAFGYVVATRSGGNDFAQADRLYDDYLRRNGKKRALDMMRGYWGVPDNRMSNPQFAAWRRHKRT